MEVITSFTIDHSVLKPGIYVSREDDGFITFDLRITEPNKEPWVDPTAMHTLEHLMATWFRNREGVKQDVVYVGPMGCMTGMYVIMKSHDGANTWTADSMRSLTIECMKWVMEQKEVPATTPETCGNCLFHNLPLAIYWAKLYCERLEKKFHSEYSKLEVILENGMKFQDA